MLREFQGHRRNLDLLRRSIERGTLPPSLIFAGPAPEKRDIALAVAEALNGDDPRIARGAHPDVLIIEPGDNGSIKIEQVRDAIDRAMYRPFEGKRRVVIIDEADALVDAAQNALLKTLEEPPSSSIFILVAARPDMLLATVRSRCIRLTFPQSTATEIDEAARDVAARVLADVAASRNPAAKLDAAKQLLAKTGAGGATDREQVASHLRAMASLLRDLALIGAKADPATLANREVSVSLERLTTSYSSRRAVDAYAVVDKALTALDRNAGVKVVADWVVLHV